MLPIKKKIVAIHNPIKQVVGLCINKLTNDIRIENIDNMLSEAFLFESNINDIAIAG